MTTEILTFQLKIDDDLSSPASSISKAIKETTAPNLKKGGARHVYYGQFIEKPSSLIMFVQWNSIDDHKSFTSSPGYEEHTSHLLKFATKDAAPITMLHVPFAPTDDPAPALGADSRVGATEVVFFYFPSTLTKPDRDRIMSSVDKMRPIVERSESLAVYDGWALEDSVPNPGPNATEGETSQVYVNVVGWVDVDAHMRFQGSEDFQQNIHHIFGIQELRHTELYHVKLNSA